MRYRLVTTRLNGEQRSIDYNTRGAAFGHFSSIALSRNIAVASLMRSDPEEDAARDRAFPLWEEVAHMEVTRQPMPEPAQ